MNIEELLTYDNIAEELADKELVQIGEELYEKVEADDDSRREWVDKNEDWLRLAAQIVEHKNYPWPDAANVKFPLLTTAAIQFHARAYPALIKDDNPVKVKVIGSDPDGQKEARSTRLSRYMSHQIMFDMEDWQEDMDRLLIILPIVGVIYKKSYYSPIELRATSELVTAGDLIINYHATNFKRARKTHVIRMDQNEVKELQNEGFFLDVELEEPSSKTNRGIEDEATGISDSNVADDTPRDIMESHTWLDLDEDGYKEPYVVHYDRDSRQVLRISKRWDRVVQDEDGGVIKIIPDEHFTEYGFLPNPNSKIYHMGFGAIIGPLNRATNTILNQLIDAGTLSNLPSGFLGRGVRLRQGNMQFKPGEWKQVQTTGDDLRKNLFPLPIKNPSMVLFNLLGTLVDKTERLSSITDIMVGENPGQNQPYSTTMAVLEQGLKVFTGIYKRVYRSLGKEFMRLYRLNGENFSLSKYMNVLDLPGNGEEYVRDFENENYDVRPVADPNIVSDTQRVLKAEALLQKLSMGMPLNRQEVALRVLQAEGHDDIEKLMDVPPPSPDPEIELKKAQLQKDAMESIEKIKIEQQNAQTDARLAEAKVVEAIARAEALKDQDSTAQLKISMDNLKSARAEATKQDKIEMEREKSENSTGSVRPSE